MNGLKNLKINGLKDLKVNGLKYLRINELKHLMHKPDSKNDTKIRNLIKSKEEVEIEIRKLFEEKKEIESRICQFQKTEEESGEISEFLWREEIFPPLRRNMYPEISGLLEFENDALQKENTGTSERIDNQIGEKVKKTEKSVELKETGEIKRADIIEINVKEEAKSASEKNEVEGDKEADPGSIRKKAEEVAFPENMDKVKIASFIEENEKDTIPEKSKTENDKPASGIFGGSLIEELLESEDLCLEEEQSFTKYIEESNVMELITDLNEVKRLLTCEEP